MSSDEIAKNKNFQTVLKKNAIMNTPLFKKPWFLSSIVAAVVATVASILLFNKYSGNNLDKSKEISTCVNPPLKNLDIKYSINKVNAEDGATLDFATGSRVTIPPDAFVDDNGNKLKGEVELRFREFHDVADFFVSGIPMTYDSAGVKYQFESAGMMELLAFQNGKKVNMASDKSVNVELASTYKGTEYNLYKLDTLHNNWSCLGKDKVSSSPIVSADSIKRDSSSSLTEKDVTIEEDVKPEIKKIEIKKEEVVKEKEKAIAALPKPAPEPKKPKQAKNEKYTFDISVDEKEFPELAIYKGVLFEIGEENKNFNPALYDITWDDATLKEGTKKGENYSLGLKKGTKKYEFIVYPVFEGTYYKNAVKDYKSKFDKYSEAADNRKKEEKKIEQESGAKIIALQKEQDELIQKRKEEYKAKLVAMQKQQEEIKAKNEAQQKNFEEQYQAKLAAMQKAVKDQQEQLQREAALAQERYYKQMGAEEKVRRVFEIMSFGIYNSDCPKHYPQGVLVSADLHLQNDKKSLICNDVFLVDKKINSLFTYHSNPITQFSFNPESANILWTVIDGELYTYEEDQFKSLKPEGSACVLQMKKVEKKFNDVDELKQYFKL
jgi:hypothetical protein